MRLAANAPWDLSATVRLIVASLLLVPLSEAIVARSPKEKFSLLSIEQVPGPTPLYVSYGPPEFTTFSNLSTACQACIEFFPEKQDGKRFHSALFEDKDGGVWDRSCRAGPCDFRDPQTDPVGGVIGQGVGPGRTPDGKSCITQDPVPWYADCDPIAKKAATSILDVTRYCSYREQLFIPPPTSMVSHFAGSKGKAWNRIGGSQEQCLLTIEKEGSNLMDSMTFCDSDLHALSGCCESVFGALTCVAETSVQNGLWNPSQGSVFSMYQDNDGAMLETFAKYCVPLCQNTKEEFCEKYPSSDVCVSHTECSNCTAGGGLWCPKLETCHCPGPKPPCIKPPVMTPLQCLPKEKDNLRGGGGKGDKNKKSNQKSAADLAAEEHSEKALCKYSKFALKWLTPEKD